MHWSSIYHIVMVLLYSIMLCDYSFVHYMLITHLFASIYMWCLLKMLVQSTQLNVSFLGYLLVCVLRNNMGPIMLKMLSKSLSYQQDASNSSAQPSFFWHDTDNKNILRGLHWLYSIVGVISKAGLAGMVPAKPSFGMTMTKISRPVLAWYSS